MARSKKHTLIVAAKRTPVLRIKKKWDTASAVDLGSAVIKDLLEEKPWSPNQIIMGNYASPREKFNPAKAASIEAGYGGISAVTVNKVCSSGLFSTILGNTLIKSGESECVLTGGMENLLACSHDTMQSLLQDPITGEMTWHAGDWCALTYGINRYAQDSWAMKSYSRAGHASVNNNFEQEILPFHGLEYDEEPFRGVNEDEIRNADLFEGCRTITAMNSSKNSGGAAGVILTSEAYADKYSIKPLAKILGTSCVAMGGESRRFTIAPPFAIREAVAKAGLKFKNIDLYFINTAFGSVTLHASRELDISLDKINIQGDAISFGHPIGATGAKLLVEAVWALKNRGQRYAVVSLCNAPAEATAMVIERL